MSPGLRARLVRIAGALGSHLARLARRSVGAAASRAAALWARRPTAGRAQAIAFALVLALAGAGGLGFQLALPSLLPSALDWRAAALLLERDVRPGDAVVTAPAWAERVRQVAPRDLRVLALPRLAPASLEGVRRVWLLSLPGAPGFDWQPETDLLSQATAPDPPLMVGRILVERYELSHPDLPLATLGDRLAGATVLLDGKPCAAESGRFRCAGDRSEATLAAEVVEVNGLPRSCILARLTGDAAPVRVTFPRVPMGRALRGNAGLAAAAEDGAAAPLTLAVRVEGEDAAAVQLEGGGWPSFRVDTTRWAGERRAVSLDFVVPVDQAICLQAVTLP